MNSEVYWIIDELFTGASQSSSGLASFVAFKSFVENYLKLAEIYDEIKSIGQREILSEIQGRDLCLCYHYSLDEALGPIDEQNLELFFQLLMKMDKLVEKKFFRIATSGTALAGWIEEVIDIESNIRGDMSQEDSRQIGCKLMTLEILRKLIQLGAAAMHESRVEEDFQFPVVDKLLTLPSMLMPILSRKVSRRLNIQALRFMNEISVVAKDPFVRQALGSDVTNFLITQFRLLLQNQVQDLFISETSLKQEQNQTLLAEVSLMATNLRSESLYKHFVKSLSNVKVNLFNLVVLQGIMIGRAEENYTKETPLWPILLDKFKNKKDEEFSSEALKLILIMVKYGRLEEEEIGSYLSWLEAELKNFNRNVPAMLSILETVMEIGRISKAPRNYESLMREIPFFTLELLGLDIGYQSVLVAGKSLSSFRLDARDIPFRSISCDPMVRSRLEYRNSFQVVLRSILIRIRSEVEHSCNDIQWNIQYVQSLLKLIQIMVQVFEDSEREDFKLSSEESDAILKATIEFCSKESCIGYFDEDLLTLLSQVSEFSDSSRKTQLWPLASATLGSINTKILIKSFDAISIAMESNRKGFAKPPTLIPRLVKLVDLVVKENTDLSSQEMISLLKLLEALMTKFNTRAEELYSVLAKLTSKEFQLSSNSKDSLQTTGIPNGPTLMGVVLSGLYVDLPKFYNHFRGHKLNIEMGVISRIFGAKLPTTNLFNRFIERWLNGKLNFKLSINHQRIQLLAICNVMTWDSDDRPKVICENAALILPRILDWLKEIKREYESLNIVYNWSRVFDLEKSGDKESQYEVVNEEDEEKKMEESRQSSELPHESFKSLEDEIEALKRSIACCKSDEAWYSSLTKNLNEEQHNIIKAIIKFNPHVSRKSKKKKPSNSKRAGRRFK